jgi:hypothetical protein
MSLLTEPPLMAPTPPAPVPAAAAPPTVEPMLVPLRPLVPACVLLVVDEFCVALVLWFVVALGLIVTLLLRPALKSAFVFTDVSARGVTDWLAVVLVLLFARLLPVLGAVLGVVLVPPVPVPVPACVLLVVPVFWDADVVWLVVPLGLIVTVLFGIALNAASVFT